MFGSSAKKSWASLCGKSTLAKLICGLFEPTLVYEQNRHFRAMCDINLQGGAAVYRLPFWHYTTPLAAKPGREKEARRWLLLASFEIVR